MNTGILIINILLLIGEIILGCILLFGKSYLQKKGKNTADKEDSQEIAMLKKIGEDIATKKDIGDITQEIKSVESKFINETEKLKAELNLLTNIKTNIVSEERNAIIEFIKCLYNLESSIFRAPSKINENKAIEQEIENINNSRYSMNCNQALFNLYIEDNELKMKALELIRRTLKHEAIIQKAFREIIMKNIEIELKQKQEYADTKAKRDVICNAFQERNKIYSQAQSKSIELYSDYIKDRATFESMCRARIYKLLEYSKL